VVVLIGHVADIQGFQGILALSVSVSGAGFPYFSTELLKSVNVGNGWSQFAARCSILVSGPLWFRHRYLS